MSDSAFARSASEKTGGPVWGPEQSIALIQRRHSSLLNADYARPLRRPLAKRLRSKSASAAAALSLSGAWAFTTSPMLGITAGCGRRTSDRSPDLNNGSATDLGMIES